MTLAPVLKRLDAYERLIRLDKPIGWLLLLWPALWALWIAAGGRPPYVVLIVFVMGTILMRSAGCAMNDWADRDFDGKVARTRDRPLAAGDIAPAEALAVGAVLAACAFVFVLFLNLYALLLSFVGLAIACLYPFSKRVFPLPQLFLGIAFAFGVPMAFATLRNALPWESWVLFAAGVAYGFAYDTEYAMVDRDDDVKLGIRTTAILFGKHDVLAVMACYALFLLGMLGIGIWQGYGPFYTGGLLVAAVIAGYHYRLIRDRSREGAFRAFRHNNWLGAAIFAGVALDQWPK